MALNQEQRRLHAELAAHEGWAHCPDRTARTAPGRRAFMDRFDKEVDPDGVLDPAERAKRAENARKAYFKRLQLQSTIARSKRKVADEQAGHEAEEGQER